MVFDVREAPVATSTAVANVYEVPLKTKGVDTKLAKVKPFETPVEVYESKNEVPAEFIINDPTKIPGRNWGDNDSLAAVDIPVIDMSPLIALGPDQKPVDPEGARRVINEMGEASSQWGFFQVINHGIPETVTDRVLEVANEFFQLPVEEKKAYSVREGETEGYGRLDFNLGGGVARTRFWNDVLRHNIRPKRFIKQDRMPVKPEAYRPVIEEYTEGMEKVFDAVWSALSVYLGLAPSTLRDAQGPQEDEVLIIRLNYYPKCLEPEKVLGVGAHKDFGSMTILLNDEVGGLQVQKPGSKNGLWLDVLPRKGTLLVNVANQVEVLSNGKYHSVLHRVMVNREVQRISVAAFATPGPKCTVAPIPELLEKTKQAPRYTSLYYGDYAKNFAIDVKAGVSPHARYEINRD